VEISQCRIRKSLGNGKKRTFADVAGDFKVHSLIVWKRTGYKKVENLMTKTNEIQF